MADLERLESVHLTCSECGRQASLDATLLESQHELSLSVHTVGRLYRKLRCKNCGSKRVRIEDEVHQTLVDPDKLVLCQACDEPIPMPRLKVMPEAKFCVPCAQDKAKPPPVPPWPQPPANKRQCPRCGSRTEVRQNTGDESYFLGCTSFPKCRWTQDFEG